MFTAFYYNQLNKTEAIKAALDSNHLEGLKYIYASRKENYLSFYDGLANKAEALQIADQLRDLEGIEYIITNMKGNLFAFLYDSFKTIDEKLKKAEDFKHLEGFKYISSSFNLNYQSIIYPHTTDLSLIANQLYYAAVELEDRDGIRSIIKQSKLNSIDLQGLFDEHRYIMQGVYYKEQLGIASLLIRNGAIFDAQDIIRPNLKHNYIEYEKHLNSIKNNINDTEYNSAISFLKAVNSEPVFVLAGSKGYSITEIVSSITYSDSASLDKIKLIYDKYASLRHKPIMDIISYKALTIIKGDSSKIIMPIEGNSEGTEYHTIMLKDPYKNHYIYAPLKYNEIIDVYSKVSHELGHSFFDSKFNNSGKPYYKKDYIKNTARYSDYIQAAKDTLVNALRLNRDDNPNLNNMSLLEIIQYTKQFAGFNLNYWAFQKSINDEVHPSLEINLLRSFYQIIKKQFNYNKTLDNLLLEPNEYKTGLLKKIFKTHELSSDDSYLLWRLYDFIHRDADQYDAELIVRLPELMVRGINKNTLKVFEPLLNYWIKYISPIVNKLENEHINECKILLQSSENNYTKYCLLDLFAGNNTNNLLVKSDTRCILIEAAINSSAYKEGKKSDALVESNAEKELLYSLERNDQDLCVEKITSKFKISQNIKNKAFMQAVEKGYITYIDIFLKNANIELNQQYEALKLTISKMNICIAADKLNDFCNHYYYDFYFNNENKEYLNEATCVIYRNIAKTSSNEELDQLIQKYSGEIAQLCSSEIM